MFIQPTSLLNLLPLPVEPTLLESVEVKVHTYLLSFNEKIRRAVIFD